MAPVNDNVSEVNRSMFGYLGETNLIMRSMNGNGRRKLKLCHQNLRGGNLTKNDDKKISLDTAIKVIRPDILGISETVLGENTNGACDYEGYKWTTKSDSSRIGVLINDSLDWRRRRDLEVKGVAAIWVEIGSQTKHPVLVCNIYREWQRLQGEPPAAGEDGSDSEAAQLTRWTLFIEVWKKVAESGQEHHILGDVNLDVRKWRQLLEDKEDDEEEHESDGRKEKEKIRRLPSKLQKQVDLLYEEILNVSEVVQLQKKISFRRQSKKGNLKVACLDLYFTNRPGKITEVSLSNVMDSDHLMVMGHRRTQDKVPTPSVFRNRKWSKIDWDKFNDIVRQSGTEEWILNCEDIDICSTLLDASVRVHLDMQQKVKIFQLRKKYCPWIDESTKMIIERKRVLYEIWKRTGDIVDKKLYRKQSNFLVKIVKKKKVNYFKQQLRITLGSHDIFKAARKQVNWPTVGPPTALKINGQLTSSNQKMAQSQNDFFQNKIKGISEKIPVTETDPLDFTRKFLKDKYVPEFNFQSIVSEYEVEKVVNGLKNSNAMGHDNISTNALKKMLPSILTSLTYIINLSLRQGVFPRIWKLAKVIPLFKNNGEKFDMKNYRPIALLPVMSKILEKFVSMWLNKHLEENRLWSDKQHGYRRNRSTATALLQLQEDIMTKYEEGHDVSVMCFDSSAAFNTLKHSIIIEKLKLYGCTPEVIKWFESYLSDRWQFCEIGGKRSTTTRILQGVFQGSVLGPLMYILYVNCISVLEDKNTKLTLYADDTTAAQRLSKNEKRNRIMMRVKAAQMQRYMDSHHLKFNAEKTNLIIKTKGKNNLHSNLNIEMGGRIIEQEDTVKVLGIIVGKDERYREYVLNSEKSMMKFLTTRLSILKILSKHADFGSRKALAEGLVLSKLNYCICLWATTTEDVLDKLQVLQNDVVRTVFGVGRRLYVELEPLYESLKWLRVRENVRYHDTIQLHSVLRHKTPQDIASKFDQQVLHTHNTRATRKAFRLTEVTRSLNSVRARGFVCRAAREYEALPRLTAESQLLPRYAFKDIVRASLGHWPIKAKTSEILFYIEELFRAEVLYF